jgi:hypothetical protein
VILVDGRAIRHAIAPDSVGGGAASHHDLADAGDFRGMQQVPGALHVSREVVLVGKIVAVVDPCQVNDGVVAGNRRRHCRQIEYVDFAIIDVLRRRLDVEYGDTTVIAKLVDHEAAQ